MDPPKSSRSTRPFLRWAGSKRNLLHLLEKDISESKGRYFEPFAGSASLFFRAAPRAATISDINPHLIRTYRYVRDYPDDVYDTLVAHPRTKQQYLKIRSKPFASQKGVELAASFIYLNRNCFNGLYRTNKAGRFNVPFSSSRTGEYPTRDEFQRMSQQLKKAKIACGDFYKTVSTRVAKGDIVYLDPPYVVRDRRMFHEYSYEYFGSEDLIRISELLRIIDKAGARFVLSYARNEIISDIAKHWITKEVTINRNISGFVSSRRKDTEVLIRNY